MSKFEHLLSMALSIIMIYGSQWTEHAVVETAFTPANMDSTQFIAHFIADQQLV